jgi:hypothetical protein
VDDSRLAGNERPQLEVASDEIRIAAHARNSARQLVTRCAKRTAPQIEPSGFAQIDHLGDVSMGDEVSNGSRR